MINENNIRDYIGESKNNIQGNFVKIIDIVNSDNQTLIKYETGRIGTIPLIRTDPFWKFIEEYRSFYL